MEKYLIYTDVNWSTYSSIIRRRGKKYSTRLHNLINSMNWVESLAVELGCTGEICCGDFFDRSDLNAEELTALRDVNWNTLPKRFIVGNHESGVTNLEYSSTKALENMNVHIISSPETISVNDYVEFTFIPYFTPDNIKPIDNYLSKSNKKKVVFAHADLSGLQYGKFQSQSGFSIQEILDSCSIFINGHLHNEQVIDNKIILVGNLTGANFNENAFIHEHLVYCLTVEDDGRLILESYENPYAFNFYKIRIEHDYDLDQLDNLKSNAIVSVVCSDRLVEEINTKLKTNANIVESRLLLTHTDSDSVDLDSFAFKSSDHIKQFIDFVQRTLEPSPALSDELARLGGMHIEN